MNDRHFAVVMHPIAGPALGVGTSMPIAHREAKKHEMYNDLNKPGLLRIVRITRASYLAIKAGNDFAHREID